MANLKAKNSDNEIPALLNRREVARILGGITTRTVHNLTHRGELKAIRVGNKHMYEPDEIRRFIAENKNVIG